MFRLLGGRLGRTFLTVGRASGRRSLVHAESPSPRPAPPPASRLDIAPAAILVNVSVSTVSVTVLGLVVHCGFDLEAAVHAVGRVFPALSTVPFDPLWGKAMLVFSVHTLIGPARYMLVASLVPAALPWYRRVVKPVLAKTWRRHSF